MKKKKRWTSEEAPIPISELFRVRPQDMAGNPETRRKLEQIHIEGVPSLFDLKDDPSTMEEDDLEEEFPGKDERGE